MNLQKDYTIKHLTNCTRIEIFNQICYAYLLVTKYF